MKSGVLQSGERSRRIREERSSSAVKHELGFNLNQNYQLCHSHVYMIVT